MPNFRHILAFLKAWIKNPRAMGAVVPSSIYLANTITRHIQRSQNGIVLELGPGTGAITKALLESGIPPQKLITIEKDTDFANKLKTQFPTITVINESATELTALFRDYTTSIDTIVSSLPLLSLNKTDRDQILSHIPTVLSPQGRFIQFTYDLRKRADFYPKNYRLIKSTVIWRNIPPARILVFKIR